MKNREIKYHVIIILCCVFTALTSCSRHSFHTKKHQRSNFLGEKKKQESYQSFHSSDRIKVNSFAFNNENDEASLIISTKEIED